jgi:4-hydroxybenzoate polyprenyltransferase
MDDELKLGFHRLGRTLEDPVNMGLAFVCLWALVVLSVTIGVALSPGTALLLIFAGVALALLLRRPIELGARRWHQGRIALEERHPRFPSHA